MRLVIDSHVMANAFISAGQDKYKLLLKELVEVLEARALASGESGRDCHKGQNEFEVFISHNHVDRDDVQEIVDFLVDKNIEHWLDRKRLKGGNDSEYEIKRAIQRVNVFLFCISGSSVNREGWHYKEYRWALDRLEKRPEGCTFIILVLLTNGVELPPSIELINAVKLYAEDGWDQLTDGINYMMLLLTLFSPIRMRKKDLMMNCFFTRTTTRENQKFTKDTKNFCPYHQSGRHSSNGLRVFNDIINSLNLLRQLSL